MHSTIPPTGQNNRNIILRIKMVNIKNAKSNNSGQHTADDYLTDEGISHFNLGSYKPSEK